MAFQRNMDPKKCPMPSQDPNVRNKNFYISRDLAHAGQTPASIVFFIRNMKSFL